MLDNSKFNILIVDDEEFNIEVVIGFLEPESYTLAYTTNAKDALRGAFKRDFDLILLDINMPEMDGFEVCQRLKKDEKTKEIPVIFLSALNDIDTITRAFEVGGVDYISKPFNGLELIARVKTHIQLKKYINELKIKQDKLAKLASIDIHTQLPNRLRFMSILKNECENVTSNPSRVSLAYIKIDNMHKINNIYGSKNGDKIISKIAKILKDSIRHTDSAARLFGSEFAILMPNTSLEAAGSIIKKLYGKILNYHSSNIQMTCSIGVSELNYGENYDIFLMRAENIMTDVKDSGGDMVSIKVLK